MKNHEENFAIEKTRSDVDFIGIINNNGRIEKTIYANGDMLPPEKMEMFCMGLRLQNSMQRDFDQELGPMNYTINERQNLKIISIPFLGSLVVVLMDRKKDHNLVINKIKAMLDSQDFGTQYLVV